jgi:hypothetical protein
MAHVNFRKSWKFAAAALWVAIGSAQANAEPGVVWVDNDSFGFASCGAPDALSASDDPKLLMDALRERGLADAGLLARTRGGLGNATVTLTPVSGALRCEGAASSMVFRLTSYDRTSGLSWSANLVSTWPAESGATTLARSTR